MLNNKINSTLVTFSADVFMCQYCRTVSGLGYWSLRLLYQGNIIDAFHWDNKDSAVKYQANDEVFIGGRWTTPPKTRFQIIHSSLMVRVAANADFFSSQEHLAFNF